VAAEMAHIFASLGVEVTVIARSGRVLRQADADVSARLTEILGERLNLETTLQTTSVRRTDTGVELRGTRDGREVVVKTEELLVATGRRPNSDLLDVAAAGIDTTADGRVVVDRYQRVLGGGKVLEGIWALGTSPAPTSSSTWPTTSS